MLLILQSQSHISLASPKEQPMKLLTLVSCFGVLGAVAGCTSDTPTEPAAPGQGSPAAAVSAVSNSWTTKAAYPGTGLFDAFAATAPNSAGEYMVYLMGGTDGEGGTGFAVKSYNVASNTWSTMASRVGVFGSNGAAKLGSKIYFSGGYNAVETPSSFTNAVWAFDYARDQMIRRADLPIFGAEGVSGVISGKLYVLPGACSGDRYPNPGYCAEEPTRRFYRYDPGANAWTRLPSSPHRHRAGAAGVINGKFYVAGGFSAFDPVADVDVYDPGTNSWKSLAPIPTAGQAIGDVIQGKLFVITSGGGELRSYAYDPNTNTWSPRAAPAQGHDGLVRVNLNGSVRLLAVGGSHGDGPPPPLIPNESELYTP
jgi:N-acetylneuraminic acid mutarotase